LPMISVAALVLRRAMAVPNRLWASYSRLPSACTAVSAQNAGAGGGEGGGGGGEDESAHACKVVLVAAIGMHCMQSRAQQVVSGVREGDCGALQSSQDGQGGSANMCLRSNAHYAQATAAASAAVTPPRLQLTQVLLLLLLLLLNRRVNVG
jgi:hypothetical protein